MTYAIVKALDNTTYVSPLYAVKFAGGESAAIGLDPSLSYVQKLDFWLRVQDGVCYRSIRGLYVVSNEYGNAQKRWSGLEWLMNDHPLMERLLAGEAVSLTEDERFSPYTTPITLPHWFELKTQTDAASLETVSFHFHDAEPVACTETDSELTVTLDTTWGCVITVRFCDVIEETFKEKVGLILDSHIEKTADGFTFTVSDGNGGWIGRLDFDTPVENAYVKCRRILWHIEIY